MVGGGPFELLPGQWTDDTSRALWLAESLLPMQSSAKTVAEAMDLKVDMENPADPEKLRRAVLKLVAEKKGRKQKRRD